MEFFGGMETKASSPKSSCVVATPWLQLRSPGSIPAAAVANQRPEETLAGQPSAGDTGQLAFF